MKKSIRILFETKNVSLVKSYVQKQLVKIMEEKTFLKEFIFAKEYRGINNYKAGACVPALSLTRYGNRPYRSFGKCNAFWSIGLLLGF